MLLPESNNKKYVKTVIGLFILFTIVSPVITKFSNGIDLKYIEEYENYLNQNTQEVSVDINSQEQDILKVYKENLSNEISAKLEQEGYKVNNINLDIETDNENLYGKINNLELNVSKLDNEKISSIEKVDINISSNTNKEEMLSKNEINKIKEIISSTYEIEEKNIIIS